MDLNYKGAYSSSTSYKEGDVVKFTDNLWYVRKAMNSNKSGYPCTDTLRWEQANEMVSTAAEMGMEAAKSDFDSLVKISKARVTVTITAESGATVFSSGATNTYAISKALSLEALVGVKIFNSNGLSEVSPSNYAVTEFVVTGATEVSVKIKNTSGLAIKATKANPTFTLDLYYID